jgi:(S)-ureidoglycine-glyoxylate aminotransferase
VDATLAVAATELRVDDWGIDVCIAGADYAVGAPSGMSLVTYSPEVQASMQARALPPLTSYLDLLQLQAYWSPERLNHHTAPTSLVYGLREALRLIQLEGLPQRWQRHAEIGRALRDGLDTLGLQTSGDGPYLVVHVPITVDADRRWRALLDDFGVHVTRVQPHLWRIGLIGGDARREHVYRVVAAFEKAVAT